MSPITSDGSDWSENSTVDDTSEHVDSDERSSDTFTADHQATTERDDTRTLSQCQPSNQIFYRLCGDNIDKTVKHRYMRSDYFQESISFHYFQSYAIADRIDFSNLSDESPSTNCLESRAQALLVLPSLEDEIALHNNFKTLISRILCEHLPFFKESFDGIVAWHIQHEYYEEMSKKSDIVSSYKYIVASLCIIFI